MRMGRRGHEDGDPRWSCTAIWQCVLGVCKTPPPHPTPPHPTPPTPILGTLLVCCSGDEGRTLQYAQQSSLSSASSSLHSKWPLECRTHQGRSRRTSVALKIETMIKLVTNQLASCQLHSVTCVAPPLAPPTKHSP